MSWAFKLVYGILPLNSRLHKLNNFYFSTALCTFCKLAEETVPHLFIDCPLVVPLWVFFNEIFFNLFNQCNHSIWWFLPDSISRSLKPFIHLLVNMLCHAIWVKRCDVHFQRRVVSSIDVRYFFIHRLKIRALADNVRLSDKKNHSLWCFNNVICVKAGNSVDFLLWCALIRLDETALLCLQGHLRRVNLHATVGVFFRSRGKARVEDMASWKGVNEAPFI